MLLIIMALAMSLPLAVSLYFGDGSQFGLGLAALTIFAAGLFLRNFLGTNAPKLLNERESYWFTLVIWIAVPLAGSLPYLFTGTVRTFTDAAFESFSGFTTTGSSVLADIDHAPEGLLVWRSISQWIGGLGLILFVVALLRRLNEGSARLVEAEFSGTLQRRLHPRMKRNVLLMWMVYSGLTALLFILLMVGGNGFVDSFCTALSTVSTGGFMTHSDGLAGFSAFSMLCITIFMFISGINLALLYGCLKGRWRAFWTDEEARRYMSIFLLSVTLCFVAFSISGGLSFKTLAFSFFHVASTVSTCGFYTAAPPVWPTAVSVITFLLVFIGASAGSTGGGLKIKRLMIMARFVRNYFIRMIHPHAVVSVKVDGKVVDDPYLNRIFSFVFLYLILVVFGAFVLTLCGVNIPNAFCMAAANMGNLGPSPVFSNLGASLNYLILPDVGKWSLVLLMLAGRIEIFALVSLLLPAYWRHSGHA